MRVILFKSYKADMNAKYINPYESALKIIKYIKLLMLLTLLFLWFLAKWDYLRVRSEVWGLKKIVRILNECSWEMCFIFYLGFEMYTMLDFKNSIVKCMLGGKTFFFFFFLRITSHTFLRLAGLIQTSLSESTESQGWGSTFKGNLDKLRRLRGRKYKPIVLEKGKVSTWVFLLTPDTRYEIEFYVTDDSWSRRINIEKQLSLIFTLRLLK